MSTREAFLAGIVANPDDDALRLVFADWLDDNGDPDRAQFIRDQVRLEGLAQRDPDRFELQERSLDLLAEHFDERHADLPKWAREMRLTFRRGFVAEAELSPASFLRHGDRLAELVPLQKLRLVGSVMREDETAKRAAMNRLRELDLLRANFPRLGQFFFLGLRAERLRSLSVNSARLARWSGLGQLTELSLNQGHGGLYDEALLALLRSEHFGSLTSLDLGGGGLSRHSLPALIRCERLVNLRRLRVEMGSDGIAPAAFADGNWPLLEAFHLRPYYQYHSAADAFQNLFRTSWMRNLRALGLGQLTGADEAVAGADLNRLDSLTLILCPVGRRAAALGRSVRELRLCHCHLDEEKMRALVESAGPQLARLDVNEGEWEASRRTLQSLLERLPALTDLRVASSQIRPAGAAALASHPDAGRLRVLDLAGVQLGPDGARELARSRSLRVARLDLRSNGLGDEGVKLLLRAPWLPSLRELCLWGNGVTCAGAEALARCPELARLRLLDLSDNPVRASGAAALAGSPHLTRLLRLRVSSGPINAPMRERLRDRFGSRLTLT
jgi:uncharacterized protein (TIGR02996 family)